MLSQTATQRVPADGGQPQEQNETVSGNDAGLSRPDFDIVVVDGESLREHGTASREREAAANAFLPVFLLSSGVADETLDPPDQREAVVGRTEREHGHPTAELGVYPVETLVTRYGGTVQISGADPGGASIEVEFQKPSSTGVRTVDDNP